MNAAETVTIQSYNPHTGQPGRGQPSATVADAVAAVDGAAAAWRSGALRDPAVRSAGLRAIAARLEARGAEIRAACAEETGLGEARLQTELRRTTGQLEAFAAVVDDGRYVEAIIDEADPSAAIRADVRRMLVPIGPVAVFGASNFPLAFSTAGGDTASALAAGCPAVVKGHPAHPSTSSLVAEEVSAGLADAGIPGNAFAHVLAADVAVARALVEHPELEAVAFTGSFAAGRDIWERANLRSRPIPVFAEMGSVNPVVIRGAALDARGAALADALVASVATSAGQLCTKPGVVLLPAGADGRAFAEGVARRLDEADPGPMLTPGLAAALRAQLGGDGSLERLTVSDEEDGGCHVAPVAYYGTANVAATDPTPLDERFGPVVTFLAYEDDAALLAALRALPGQLTCTLHTVPGEDPAAQQIAEVLAERCGRLLFAGMPTGVLVNDAMQHGGPWPATTAPAHTSVGMTAIRRFLRPVAWQSAPAELLPPELQDDNPRGIWRVVAGGLTRAPLEG